MVVSHGIWWDLPSGSSQIIISNSWSLYGKTIGPKKRWAVFKIPYMLGSIIHINQQGFWTLLSWRIHLQPINWLVFFGTNYRKIPWSSIYFMEKSWKFPVKIFPSSIEPRHHVRRPAEPLERGARRLRRVRRRVWWFGVVLRGPGGARQIALRSGMGSMERLQMSL